MWFLFQSLIIGAIASSNVYWQWTPNPLVSAGAGIGIAFVTTEIINKLLDWRRRRVAKRATRQQKIY